MSSVGDFKYYTQYINDHIQLATHHHTPKRKYLHTLWVFLFYGMYTAASQTATTPLPTKEDRDTVATEQLANTLFTKGDRLVKKSDFKKAIPVLKQSLAYFQELEATAQIGACLTKIGTSYYYLGGYEEALQFFTKSIAYYKALEDHKGVSSTLNNMGAIYYYTGKYPEALRYYKKALTLQEAVGHRQMVASINQNIGGIYVELGKYDKALSHFRKAQSIFEKTADTLSIAQALQGIGEIYLAQKKPKKALQHIEKALLTIEKTPFSQQKMEILFSLATVHRVLEHLAVSKTYYLQCLSYATTIQSAMYQSMVWIALGRLEVQQQQYTLAIQKCTKGMAIARSLQAVSVQKDGCDCLYTAYKAIGHTRKSLDYHEQLQRLKDSLAFTKTADQLVTLEYEKQQLLDSIAYVQKQHRLETKHQAIVLHKEKQRNLSIFAGACVFFVLLGIWSRLQYVRKSKAVLQLEKDRSEHLLLNILPKEIAHELKQKGYVDAQDFDSASILFTDFKSFTVTASTLSPQQLVAEINCCFEAFDRIVDKYGIEKIKTIGDAYMAAGGLPKPDAQAVKKTILAALEMQAFIADRKRAKHGTGFPAFDMRVGIHVGPIVAGIVGVKKFQYDVWGDTVNIASRMESNGTIGNVNISEHTYQIIKEEAEFSFEHRGKIQVKGKGAMDMYYVYPRA